MTLHFCDKKQKLIAIINTDEFKCGTSPHDVHLFGTNLEYLITLRFCVAASKYNYRRYSFIEVFDVSGVFIRRHFVREHELSPIISTEQDRTHCPLIRQKQISSVPILNWRKVQRDSFLGRGKRNITLHQFTQRYE